MIRDCEITACKSGRVNPTSADIYLDVALLVYEQVFRF